MRRSKAPLRGMPAISVLSGVVLCACAALLGSSPVQAQTPVAKHGELRVKGNRIVDSHGQPVTLRGMALYWSQWKPAFYNARCVRWLRDDWKCTVVRASMAVGAGGYLSNPSREMNKVKAVVQAAIDLGIYVIVDWHDHEAQSNVEKAKAFFGEISRTYGRFPNVIYETWNEPLPAHSWPATIKPYHEALIKAIRANDPDNIVLCGTGSWSQDVDEASRDRITIDPNVAYTLHFYAASHRASLRAKARAALDNGIALMVTEGGLSEASGGGALDTAEARRWVEFLDGNGIAWMNWSVADLAESSAALRPGASGEGNWSAGQLSPSGAWVRNRLRAMDGRTLTASLVPKEGSPRTLRAERGRLRLGPGADLEAFRELEVYDLRGQRRALEGFWNGSGGREAGVAQGAYIGIPGLSEGGLRAK